MSLVVKQLFYQFFINYGKTISVNGIIFVLVAPHIFCVIFKTKKSEMCRKKPELWSVTYIHTYRQSDMAFFFLRMRLLASPFGLAIIFDYENFKLPKENVFSVYYNRSCRLLALLSKFCFTQIKLCSPFYLNLFINYYTNYKKIQIITLILFRCVLCNVCKRHGNL
jgi:hypothetical protein